IRTIFFEPKCLSLIINHCKPFSGRDTILQHYKSPLLCSGVTSRKGQRCKNGLVNVGLTVPRYPQSVRDGFRFSSENSKVCSMAHRTVFRA
ncbi:hypothetical protein EAI99_16580, partial [Alistipes onderdonkii]